MTGRARRFFRAIRKRERRLRYDHRCHLLCLAIGRLVDLREQYVRERDAEDRRLFAAAMGKALDLPPGVTLQFEPVASQSSCLDLHLLLKRDLIRSALVERLSDQSGHGHDLVQPDPAHGPTRR